MPPMYATAAPSAKIGRERGTAELAAGVARQQALLPVVEGVGVLPAQPAHAARRALGQQLAAHVAEARAVARAQPLVARARERVDLAPAHVHRERADRLAAADHEVAGALDAAESVQVLAAAVRELHVADGDRRRVRRLPGSERLEPQHALGRGDEAHRHAAVDPRQRDRRELVLVRDHRPVALDEVGDQVDAARGVGHEGDLVGLRPDEAGDGAAHGLALLEPGLPVLVPARLELAVEGVDRLAHGPRRERRGRRVQVRAPAEPRKIAPDLVPERGHRAEG